MMKTFLTKRFLYKKENETYIKTKEDLVNAFQTKWPKIVNIWLARSSIVNFWTNENIDIKSYNIIWALILEVMFVGRYKYKVNVYW